MGDRASEVNEALALMRSRGKTFAWSARALTRNARFDAALLYAFARRADDIADEGNESNLPLRQSELARLIADCERGESADAACRAALAVLQRNDVSPLILAHLLKSLLQDMTPSLLNTEQDLLHYAYGVAGTVGLLMRPILGAAPHADSHAVALGLAMQLTNIARDVHEDAARGRRYLPSEFFTTVPSPAQLLAPSQQTLSDTGEAISRVLRLADQLYAYAVIGLAHIPARNRHAIGLAAQLYRQIGVKLLRVPIGKHWGARVSVSAPEKAWISLQVLVAGARMESSVGSVPAKLAVLGGLPGVSW
jgi:15-cis-phytoene synthase